MAVMLFFGVLESTKMIDVPPLPVARLEIDVVPPLAAIVCGLGVAPAGDTVTL